jgi:hypothetical protein
MKWQVCKCKTEKGNTIILKLLAFCICMIFYYNLMHFTHFFNIFFALQCSGQYSWFAVFASFPWFMIGIHFQLSPSKLSKCIVDYIHIKQDMIMASQKHITIFN